MAPILKKGLFCCVSLRTCVLILGSVTLVGNLLTLSMFVVSLDVWLSEPEYHHHWNHTALSHELANAPGGLHPDVLAAIANATAGDPSHPWAHPAIEAEDYSEDGIDSETMEELLERSPHLALALVWFDFVLVLLETLAVVLLLWGAIKRRAELLPPWLGVELFTTLYDLGFFAYLCLSQDVYIAIDLMPIILLPITVYCWLVVYSLYQEFKETASRNAAMPLSMSALEAGAGAGSTTCTVPYGRMTA